MSISPRKANNRVKKKVLFLCTGNSCRSQMAEGLLRHINSCQYEAYSAGIKPSTLNPKAVQVMKEIGVDISNQHSKSADEFIEKNFNVVITVCDDAKESCPVFPGSVKRIHWSITDPAKAEGSEENVLEVFRAVRAQLQERIENEFGGN